MILLLKKQLNKILLPFFSISIFFLLLVGPLLYYSFSPSFYAAHEVQNSLAENVYSFIQGKSSLDPVFTLAEKSHLEDVRQIFHVLSVSEIIASIIFLLILLIFIWQKKFSFIIRGFFRGSISIFLFLLVLLIALYFDFQAVFILFHKLFFPQGNYLFNDSSVMINLFPLGFFQAISLRVFLVSIVLSLLVLILDVLEKRYWRKK